MKKGYVSVRHRKGRDSWYYKVCLGPDPHTEKRIFRVKSGFATEAEAQTAMNLSLRKQCVAQNCCRDGQCPRRGGLQ